MTHPKDNHVRSHARFGNGGGFTLNGGRFTLNGGRFTLNGGRFTLNGGGFTLVELMVSIAIVLLLVLGINEVFRVTGNTIGSGQSLSRAMSDQRTARNVMEDDFNNMAADAPCLIITNQAVAAFRDRQDEIANAGVVDDSNASVATNPRYLDLNGDGKASTSNPGEVLSPATPNSRIHRIDTITFFTRKLTRRQTGNLTKSAGNTYYNDLAGNTATAEALVMYGHARQPDNAATTWFEPGEPEYTAGYKATKKNDNNKYASQWVLGRRQLVLTPYLLSGSESAWQPTPSISGGVLNLTPLSMATINLGTNMGGTPNVQDTGSLTYNANTPRIWNSYQDVAVASINSVAKTLAQYERDVARTTNPSNGVNSTYTGNNNGLWYLPAEPNSYDPTASPTNATQTLVYRPDINPFGSRGDDVTNKVVNSLGGTLAQTAPIFIPRCTQFIVEYAGDYLTQNNTPGTNYGDVTATTSDGTIDYYVFHGQRKIRWYGLPRYTGSGNTATGAGTNGAKVAGRVTTVAAKASNELPDVVPLADVVAAWNSHSGTRQSSDIASFERVLLTNGTSPTGAVITGNYYYPANNATNSLANITPGNCLAPPADYNTTTNFPLANANYICAWRPGTSSGLPKLIRITMTLEDPSGQTQPQTFEYIFNVPN